MKQLNNANGRVISIDKIDIQNNRIVYSIHEFGDKNVKLSQESHKFTEINLQDYLSETVNYTDLVNEQLAVEKETGYTYSDDNQNWTILKGSEGNDTLIRVYIPASLINKEVNTGSAFDLLMKQMSPLAPFTQRNGVGSMQYLEELTEPAISILNSHLEDGVKIENKI